MRTNHLISSVGVRLVLVVALLMAVCATVEAAESKPGERYDLRLRGLRVGSGFTMMMTAMGQSVKRHYPNITSTVTPSSSGLENAVALHKGSADIACTMDSLICRAGSYQIEKAGPLPNIRNIIAVGEAPLNIFVTQESGITSIEQLNGKSFAGNLPGTMVLMVFQYVLEEMGVKPDLKFMGTAACGDAIKDRKVVGSIMFGAPRSSVTELNATMRLKFLPIPKDVLDRLVKKHAGFLSPGVLEAGTYAGQNEDIPTVTNTTILGTSVKVPEWVIYAFLESVSKDRDRIAQSWAALNTEKGFLGFEKFSLVNMQGWMHEGVVKWFKDKGHTVPARFIPEEMK